MYNWRVEHIVYRTHNCMSVFCSHELILLVHLQTLSSHVTALAVDSNNTVLVSGDLHGMNIIIQPIMLQEVITILQLYLYGYLRLLSVWGSLVSNIQDSSVYGTSRLTVQTATTHNNQIVGWSQCSIFILNTHILILSCISTAVLVKWIHLSMYVLAALHTIFMQESHHGEHIPTRSQGQWSCDR